MSDHIGMAPNRIRFGASGSGGRRASCQARWHLLRTLNVGQQIGGSIGLAALATVAAAAARSATSSRIAALSSRVSADDLLRR